MPPLGFCLQREGGAATAAVGSGTGAASAHTQHRSNPCIALPRVKCTILYLWPLNQALCSWSGETRTAARPAAGARLSLGRLRHAALAQLAATFLPAGYPKTVAPGYLRNTLWQAAHHTAGSANGGGTHAAMALLGPRAPSLDLPSASSRRRCRSRAGLSRFRTRLPRLPPSLQCWPPPSCCTLWGLGAGAIPTAGALNWVLKDGLGQLGTLLFGKTIAHNFDVSPRAWYLLASAKLNLAMG